MPVSLAYCCVVLIWSTTPLAMKWSTEGVGFLFAVTSRMGIGMSVALLLCALSGIGLSLQRKALLTYLVSGTGVYLTMICSYWAVQFIPSGWVSVIFGLAPVITSLLGSFVLRERLVSITKTGSLAICLTGLLVMFRQNMSTDVNVAHGVLAVIAGTLCYSTSLVAIKAINADIRPITTMTGTLIITVVLLCLTWCMSGTELPVIVSTRAAGAILYLGVIGSVLGFMLFYFVLQQVEATRAALITLITPGCALILGNLLNNEPLTPAIMSGCLLVLFGLLLFQFGDGIVFILRNTVDYES